MHWNTHVQDNKCAKYHWNTKKHKGVLRFEQVDIVIPILSFCGGKKHEKIVFWLVHCPASIIFALIYHHSIYIHMQLPDLCNKGLGILVYCRNHPVCPSFCFTLCRTVNSLYLLGLDWYLIQALSVHGCVMTLTKKSGSRRSYSGNDVSCPWIEVTPLHIKVKS